jgi:hypothetical protein
MDWMLLLVTLPTQPGAVRLRLWRSLKAMGCGLLRDGAYLLPAPHAAALDAVAEEVQAHGGTAAVFELRSRSAPQEAALRALFDRGEAYAQWRESVQALARELPSLGETAARRRFRSVAEALQGVQQIDFFAGEAAAQAQVELESLRREIDALHSAGEPHARAAGALPRLDRARYAGRRWATRARPWVDRLACCWLIRRFIDPQARFVWLQDVKRVPRGAIGFDFDGARFSHVGSRVTFEVMAAAFGLDHDPRLRRIAAAVHYLDVGGIPAPEAAGLEAVLAGLRELHADDDALAAAAGTVFDAFYAASAGTASAP